MNDKRDQLYDNLINSGKVSEAEIGSRDEFKAAISDETKTRQFYKNIIGSKLLTEDEIGSEDDFFGSISSDFAPSPGPGSTKQPMLNAMRDRQPQPKPAAVPSPEKKQGSYQPTWQDRMRYGQTIDNAGYVAGASLSSYEKKASNLQKRQGLNVPKRVNLGETNNLVEGEQHLNPETGELEQGYITSAGNEYDSKAGAEAEQRQIDDYDRKFRYATGKGMDELSDRFVAPLVDEAMKRADEEWFASMGESMAVPMGEGMELHRLRNANKKTDPERILKGLQKSLESVYENPEMQKEISRLADSIGMSRDEYLEQVVAPSLAARLENKFASSQIAKNMPKNATEYILQGLGDSIGGMLMNAATETKSQRDYKNQAEALTEQGDNPYYNPGTGAKLSRMGISFAADAPFFGIYGRVSGQVAKKIAERQISKMTAKGLSENAARSIVGTALENSVGARMKNYLMQHVVSSSLTLGGYNATSEMARQVRDKEGVNLGKIAESTAEGLATGAAFGVTGGVSQALSQPLSGIRKIGAKVAGFGAEAETMYATEELAKLAHGEDAFTNPFEGSAEAIMKLGVMKVSGGHLLKAGADKLIRAKEVGGKQVAMETLAGIFGRNRSGVEFTPEEQEYIRNSSEGKNLVESLSQMHPEISVSEVNGKKSLTSEGEQLRRQLADNYNAFMENSEIPASTKQKVAQVLGGLYHPGLETGADIIHNTDGSVVLKTRDKDGNCIQDIKFDSFSDADAWRDEHTAEFRLNDAVNGWNGTTEENRRSAVTEIAETFGISWQEAKDMVYKALDIKDTSLDGDQYNMIFDIINRNAYPEDEYNPVRRYQEGKQVSNIDRHKVQVEAQLREEQLRLLGDDFAEEVIAASEYPDEKMAELASRDGITKEQIEAAMNYYNATAKLNGVMDEALKSIDEQVEAENARILKNVHTDSGSLIEASYDDGQYYITAGHFQLSPDGRLVPTDNSGLVILRDKNTGDIVTASPSNVTASAVYDPNRILAENDSMEGLRGQLVKEAEDTMELRPDTPTEVANGDIYKGADGNMYMAMQVQDEAGNPVWSKVLIGENGEVAGNPMPFDMNEYRKAKSDEMDAAEIPHDETAGTVNDQAEHTNINENSFGQDAEEEGSASDASETANIDVSYREGGGTDVPPSRAGDTSSRIPVDEKGKKLYEQAAPEDVLAELSEKYGAEKARQMIAKIAENIAMHYEELSNKDTSKITDMDKLEAHEDELAETEQKMRFWQDLLPKEEAKTDEQVVEPEKPAEPEHEPAAPETPSTPVQEPETPVVQTEESVTLPEEQSAPQQPEQPSEPQQPAGPTAEQKVAQGTVKNNIGNRFGFHNQDGTRSEVVIDAFNGDDMVTVTRQDYDGNGQRKGEPYQQDLNLTDVGNSIVNGVMKPALTTREKLGKVFKVTVGKIPLIDVLTEAEQQQLLDLYAKNDKEAIGNLTGDLIDAHHEDLILKGRDNRNQKVDQILNSNAGREQKLRQLRQLYDGDIVDSYLSDDALFPASAEEWVSELNSRVPKSGEGPLAYFSYDKDGSTVVGMQDETGFGTKSGGDNKGFAPWLAPKGKGMSLQRYGELLHSQLPENLQEQYSVQDMRNAVRDVFGSAERPSDIPSMIIRRSILQAENAARRMEEQWIEGGPTFHKISADDRLESIYTKQALLSNSSDGHLAEQQDAVPDLLPTQENNASFESKGTNNSGNNQGNQQESTFIGATSSPEQIAEEEAKVDTAPSEGQKEAGNYQKGHIKIDGLDITIENPKGSIRRGTDASGKPWETEMHNTYGYIRGTEGADKDHIDVFLSDDPTHPDKVFIVQQRKKVNGVWKFDELKVLLGFENASQASNAYLSNYEEGWNGMDALIETDMESFKDWLKNGKQNGTYKEDGAWAKIYPGVSTMVADEGKMPEPEQQEVQVLRGTGDNRLPGMDREFPEVSGGYGQASIPQGDSGQNRRRQGLLQGELQVDGLDNPVSEPKNGPLPDLQGQNDVNAAVGRGNGASAEENKIQNPDLPLERGENTGNSGRDQGQLQNDNISGQDNENGRLGEGTQSELQNVEEPAKTGLDNGKNSNNTDGHKVSGRVYAASRRETVLRDAVVEKMKEAGIDVSTDWEEGQRILDEYNGSGSVKKMGSRVDSKKNQLSEELGDREMTEAQKTVANVFTGKSDNQPLTVLRDGKELTVKMRQGNEQGAGTKHSLFRHYGTGTGVITADDVMRIPDVLADGERTEKERGNVKLANYRLRDENGVRYTVVTEIKKSGEVFNDFYTNKKASNQTPQMPNGDTPESARTNDLNASSDAKVQQNSETAKDSERKFFKTPDGHAYGYTYKGKIYIDPRIATSETPIHEYGHLWAEMKRQTAPEEWNNIKQVMLGDKLVQPIIEKVKRDYPELTQEGKEDDFIEEIITQFSGKRGAERLREIANEVAAERGGVFGKAEAMTAMQRLKNILNQFWEGVAKMMGWKYRNANQVADRIMADMLNGVNPREQMKDGADRLSEMRAYHGSAAEFDRFDHTKVGSGEGQAVSGYGTYVTSSEGTARYYANVASTRQRKVIQPMGYTFDGEVVKDPALARAYDYLKKAEGNVGEAIKACEHTIEVLNRHKDKNPFGRLGNGKSTAEEAMDYLLKEKEKPGTIGFQEEIVEQPDRQLYEVEIPDDTGKNYFDLDKKLTKKQKEDIKKRFFKALDSSDEADYWKKNRDIIEYEWKHVDSSDGTGDAARGVMEQFLPSEKVSEIFSDMGYVGSKVKGSDGTTYIIYNADSLQIKDRMRFQMMGRHGAAEADKAEGTTTRQDNMSVAEDMEKAGKDAKAIKLATGWERGADGQWRYEIPDADVDILSKYKTKADEMKKDGVAKPQPIIKLGELLGEDNEMFRYYPDLKKTDVLFSDTLPDGTAGSFDGTNIELNAKELNRFEGDDLNNENVYGTLLHEVQHAIQEKEGFALGGNLQTSTTEDGINAIIEKKERQRADIKTRLDANNKILSDPENLKMSAELEGKTEKEVRDQLTDTIDQQAAEYDTLGLQIDRLRHTKAPSMTDAKDLYHRLAGEVESRNVTERMGMTGEQRRQSLASETEDVSREDQVIINAKENENNSLKFQKVEGDTHSDNFKNFFGDWERDPDNASKIVDREGEPMVVYHQTANDFTVFDPRHKGAGTNDYQLPFGIFMKPSARDIGVGGEKQMALYANIRKPLRVGNRQELSRLLQSNVEGYKEALAEYEKIDREYSKKFDEAMKFDHDRDVENWNKWKSGEITEEEYQNAISDTAEDVVNQWKEAQSKPIAKMKELVDDYFKNSEYDGIWIAKDEGSMGRSTETIIAFEPNQVKSATDNNGDYDPNNPDIRFQRTGSPEPEMTPEERQYWNQWDAAMKKWKERNAIPEDVTQAPEKPRYQQGENAMDYAKKLLDWNKQKSLWQTAPKLEDYRQVRTDRDSVEEARKNEQRYPESQLAKMRRVAAETLRLRHAMMRQRAYDKATVKAVTDLAHDFMTMGFGDHLSRGEMERILSSVKNATGAKDIKKQVDNIMNILVDNQLRNLDQQVVKLSSTKELRQTAQGVERQGKLELKGQRMIQKFREAREARMTAEAIKERMAQVMENIVKHPDSDDMWEQEYEGLSIALQYAEDIDGSRQEYKALDDEYKDAVKDYKGSGRSYKAQQELLESLDRAMMENKMERIGSFGDIIGRLEGNIAVSMEGAREFLERDKQRVKHIHDMANFDLAGKEMGAMRKDTKGKPANFFLQPLGTFEQMLRQFGSRNASGEGHLYDYFMRNWMDATDKAYLGEVQAKEELDAKAREVFGGKVKRWSDLYKIVMGLPTMDVEVADQGDPKTFTLTQGNLLYIYMANKMNDGAMKLRKMGIDEETVEKVKDFLDPRLVQLGDWLQDEYLPGKRVTYNKVHERMFGAPMAAIDHYFPIKILGDARVQEQDVNVPDSETLPSTITGNIIKRRRNTLPLDILNTDALSLAIEHVEDMERWAAQAEWNRDINTLLSYTTFRNKVKNMDTIYGSGDALWNTFKDAAKMAAGTYNPSAKSGHIDKAVTNIAKGVTAAKISFRVYTAFKQILSAPAFLHDVDLGKFVKDSVNPYGSWKWAMENMPVFRKRWESRQMGDTRLMDDPTDWKMWKNNLVQMATMLGMSPNALVDGITCAVGARAIYESRLKKYKQIGASDEVARKRALQDAEIGYNLTQQSSEGAFVSAIQKDRTVAANMLSVFRNSSMAYTRQWVDAARNLKHRMQKGYKEDSIGFMTRQFEEQFGLDEEQARHAAEAEYARAGRRDVGRMLNMMFGVTIAWNLGASLPYLLIGDDDDTKKEMMTDALVKGLLAGPTEGFAAGNLMSEMVGRMTSEQTRQAIGGDGWGAGFDAALKQGGDYEVNPLPLMADIQNMIKKLGYDKYAAAQDVFNICVQSAVGVNPQTFTDMWNACMDYGAPGWDGTSYTWDKDNLARPKEIALFIMRLMNAPTSSWRNKYIDELGMDVEDAKKLSYDEMAKRYAHYKHWKDAPLMGWLRGEEGRQEKMDKIRKQFDKAVQERIGRLDYEELRDNLEQTEDESEKKLILKEMKSQAKTLSNKDILKEQTSARSDDERKMLSLSVAERAKEEMSGYSDRQLADSIDGASSTDRKNAFAGEFARRQGSQDYGGRKNASREYQRLRTYEDIKEDLTMAEMYAKVKESLSEKDRKRVDKLKRQISGQKNKGLDGPVDEDAKTEMLSDIRKWRRECLEILMRADSSDNK